MKNINTYLIFDGNCREAMEFYKSSLGGELMMMPFSEGPKSDIPMEAKNRIMHARLTSSNAVLMASDNMPGMPFAIGDNFSISIDCSSKEEVDKFFNNFSSGGKITMPVQDTFWGAYFGMLTDKFGVSWMFSFDKAHQ